MEFESFNSIPDSRPPYSYIYCIIPWCNRTRLIILFYSFNSKKSLNRRVFQKRLRSSLDLEVPEHLQAQHNPLIHCSFIALSDRQLGSHIVFVLPVRWRFPSSSSMLDRQLSSKLQATNLMLTHRTQPSMVRAQSDYYPAYNSITRWFPQWQTHH